MEDFRFERGRRRGLRGSAATALMVCALLPAAACAPGGPAETASTSAAPPALFLDFDDVRQEMADGDEISHESAEPLSVTLLVSPGDLPNGNEPVRLVEDRDGGQALRLPTLVPRATKDGEVQQPLGVLNVSPLSLGPPHPLDPADQPFSFGAAFQLDARSDGSSVDGGDNLMGRGSFDDPAQYKVQVDNGVPSCRVAGRDGDVLVKANLQVTPRTWYALACSRDDDGLELTLTEYDGDESLVRSWTEGGVTGDLGRLDPSVPLAIGGKLTPTGSLVRSETDQFNGTVDDVWVRIGE